MEKINILDNIEYGIDRPLLKILIDNIFVKEMRITFRKAQEMKTHQSKYPIMLEVLEGKIDIGTSGDRHLLHKGMLLTLEASVLHDLVAVEDTIMRLSILKCNLV